MNRRRFLKSSLLWVPSAPYIVKAAVLPNQRHVAAKAAAGSSGPSYIFQENFETPTTGYENTWFGTAAGGTLAPATSTSGLSLQGAQCLHIIATAQGTFTSANFTSSPEIYIYLLFRIHSTAAANKVPLSLLDNTSTTFLQLYILATSQLDFYDGSNEAKPTDATGLDTSYSVWLHYKKGTGANAVMEVEYATTPTQVGSGSKYASFSNGVGTSNVTGINLGDTSAYTSDLYFDKLRISTTPIGSNPT